MADLYVFNSDPEWARAAFNFYRTVLRNMHGLRVSPVSDLGGLEAALAGRGSKVVIVDDACNPAVDRDTADALRLNAVYSGVVSYASAMKVPVIVVTGRAGVANDAHPYGAPEAFHRERFRLAELELAVTNALGSSA